MFQSFHVTHKWSDADTVQELATVPAGQLAEAVRRMPGVAGCVVLVTCHRSELYLTSHDPDGVRQAVAAHFQSETYRRSVAPHGGRLRPRSTMRELTRTDTVRHLFRVASGLDSVILGETEVLGQVRSALRNAEQARTVHARLRHLFEAAVETGRRVRSETDLGMGHRSLGAAVWRALESCLPGRDGNVLLVGAGQAAASIAESMPRPWGGTVAVMNRGERRGKDLARRVDASFRRLAELPDALRDSDACVLAAPVRLDATSRQVLDAGRRVLVLDVCQPPNLRDPGTGGAFEYWDLTRILTHAGSGDGVAEGAAEAANRIVEEAVARFEREEHEPHTPAGRLLRMLHVEGERIARRELETALRRLPTTSQRERAVLEDFARSVREKLLMRPTLALRRSLEEGRPDVAHEILDLFAGDASDEGAPSSGDEP